MRKKVIYTGSVVLLALGLCGTVLSQQSAGRNIVSRVVAGRVSGISNDYIAVVYKTDEATHTEYEVLLPLDKKPALKFVKTLGQIKAGDTVSVDFEEDTGSAKKHGETVRRAKGVTFIRAAPKVQESDVLGAQ